MHYFTLNLLRRSQPVLVNGDFKVLLADDANQLVAYGRKTEKQAALVIVNRGDTEQAFTIPVAGYLPDGVLLRRVYAVGMANQRQVTVANGTVSGTIGPLSALILISGPRGPQADRHAREFARDR